MSEAGLIDAEKAYLKGLINQLQQRIVDLESLKEPRPEEKLDRLPWKLAKSGKCYWIKGDEVPQELKELMSNDGFKTEKYHYTLTKDGNALRFDRHSEAKAV